MPPKDRGEKELPHEKEETSDVQPHIREHSGVKRAREGSLEPTPSPNPTPLATKKNRTDLDSTAEGSEETPGAAVGAGAGGKEKEKETKNVGEVRKKVEEMTWKEGQPKPQTEGKGGEESEVLGDEEVREAKEKVSATREGEGEGETRSSTDLKRKTLERNESSVLQSEEPAKKVKESPSPPPAKSTTTATEESAPAPAPAPAKKPQSSFSAFSSSASPFASARTSSPFASASTGAGASASISAFGSASSSKAGGSAFGNYSASSSPFAGTKKPAGKEGEVKQGEASAGTTAASPSTSTDAAAAAPKTAPPPASTFGDILKESKADEEDTGDKVQMTEKDVHTGEEGEETVYQTRAKLYVMQSDGGWKERGVGTLRLNVRASDGKGARLVMRAEGVLRLILNVSLYVGMSVLEDGKHVRSTVFEEKERRLVTFRLGTQKAAAELCANIQDHIPLESSSTPAPDAPSPTPV